MTDPRFAALHRAEPRALELLRQRAEALARRSDAPEEAAARAGEPARQFVHFRLGRAAYGIDYRHVEEVLTVPAVTRVPCAPPFIAGVINRRGDMLAVLDLQHLLHGASEPAGSGAVDIVVVQGAGLLIGIRVDALVGNDSYRPAELAADLPPGAGGGSRRHFHGLLNGAIGMLDLDTLLADPAVQGPPDEETPPA